MTRQFATGGVIHDDIPSAIGMDGPPPESRIQVRVLNPSPVDVARYIGVRFSRLPKGLRPSRFPRTPIRRANG